MNERLRIVMGGAFPWRSPVQVGIHHYARRFAADGWNVFYLSSQLSPLHFLARAERDYTMEKLRAWQRGGVDAGGGITAYSYMTLLPVLPQVDSRFIIRHTLAAAVPPVARAAARHGFGRPDVLWIENPHLSGLPRRLPHRCLVYRVADNVAGFAGMPRAVLEAHERAVDRADLVVVTAHDLYETYAARRGPDRVLFLPNGVDFAHFQRAGLPRPPEYANLAGPIVVYAGSLHGWFDDALLCECAERLPAYQFVVIGPVRVPPQRMAARRNIHLLGPRPYEQVPAYFAHAHIGMIPFKRTPLVESVNPVKLYEYMACGLPVVATAWREIERMQSPARLAAGADAFCAQLQAASREPGREACVAFARANDWHARYQELMPRLRALLALTEPAPR